MPDPDLPHVLITEDDADLRATLLEVLGCEGYVAVAVDSIELARAQLGRFPFSVLLLDSGLVGSSGLDWLLGFAEGHDAPRTIILSGSHEAARLGERFNVKVLAKPFDIEALLEEIQRVTQSNARPSSGG